MNYKQLVTLKKSIIEAFSNNDINMLNTLLAIKTFKLVEKDTDEITETFKIDTLIAVSSLLKDDEIRLIMENWYLNFDHELDEVANVTDNYGPVVECAINMCLKHHCHESFKIFINKFPDVDYYKMITTPTCTTDEKCHKLMALHIINKLVKSIAEYK